MEKIILIFLFLFFSTNVYSWEKVPVPDYVDKKTKSPWNFFENFEDQKKGVTTFINPEPSLSCTTAVSPSVPAMF